MDYILFIMMIAVFFLGFIFIDKIYNIVNFTDSQPNLVENNKIISNSKRALVFGKNGISEEIINLFSKYNISYTMIEDTNELNKFDSYNYLIAISNIDLENIVICLLGKKMMGINKIIALCNCTNNKIIYENNKIPYLIGNSISASQLDFALFLSSEKTGGKNDVHI